jgi:tetratricopeptide (TPR) repeat protein
LTNQANTAAENAPLTGIQELIANAPQTAVEQLRERLGDEPFDAEAYRLLSKALKAVEQQQGAGGGIRTFVQAMDPLIARAAQALNSDDLETAEIILRNRLLERPTDFAALHLMANLASTLDFDDEADDLLQLVLEIAPEFTPARVARASGLKKRNRPLEAAEALDPVFEHDPNNTAAKALKASVLARAGRFDDSLKLYEELLQTIGEDPKLLSNYGHILSRDAPRRRGRAEQWRGVVDPLQPEDGPVRLCRRGRDVGRAGTTGRERRRPRLSPFRAGQGA